MARTKNPHLASVKSWETRRKNRRGDWQDSDADRVSRMATLNPTGMEELGGGLSLTFEVRLEDGSKAIFRVSGGGDEGENEYDVGAFSVAGLVGMSDMVPAAAIREFDNDAVNGVSTVGALCEWMDGTVAQKLPFEQSFGDSLHDLRRAAVFDYVIGNSDRHAGNWVVNDEGSIKLIDHNLAFGQPYSVFLMRLRGQVYRVVNSEHGPMTVYDKDPNPARADKITPSEFSKLVKPYIDSLPKIKTRLAEAGVFPDEIEAVEKRIQHLASCRDWADIDTESSHDLLPSEVPSERY